MSGGSGMLVGVSTFPASPVSAPYVPLTAQSAWYQVFVEAFGPHDGGARWTWVDLMEQDLAEKGPLPERTWPVTLQAWREQSEPGRIVTAPGSARVYAAPLVLSGVAVLDLAAWAVRGPDDVLGPNEAAHALVYDVLHHLCWEAPEMVLRDALGWALAMREHGQRVTWVRQWLEAGVGTNGWVFPSAGMTLDEARAALAAGALDADAARGMAGLRAARVPVG